MLEAEPGKEQEVEALGSGSVSIHRHAQKLEDVAEQLHTAKGVVKAFGWILSILGAVGLLLLGTILTVILKHFKLI
jgi:hypothetical protein